MLLFLTERKSNDVISAEDPQSTKKQPNPQKGKSAKHTNKAQSLG